MAFFIYVEFYCLKGEVPLDKGREWCQEVHRTDVQGQEMSYLELPSVFREWHTFPRHPWTRNFPSRFGFAKYNNMPVARLPASDLAIAEPQSCFGNQRQVFFASDSLEFSFQNSPLRFFEIWRTTMAIVVWLHNAHFCLICIQQKRFLRVQGGVSSEAKNPILQNETIFQGVVLTVLYRTFTIVSRGLKIDWILFSAANIQMRLTIKCILYGLKVD